MKFLRILLLSFSGISIASCTNTKTLSNNNTNEIRNVILMIGDGMGLPDVNAAMTVSRVPLNIERCNYTGLQKTFSASNYITDSGASGTALATGVKTRNGMIGTDSTGHILKSILEIAEDNNLSTGLVSTSAITHATPASFIAHNINRSDYEGIALDFLKTDIDVFIGGGTNHFARRKDNLNLLDSFRVRGYEVDTTLDAILASHATKLAGLTAAEHNPSLLEGRGDMLPKASAKAIDILKKNDMGFFLMIEGSQIDFAGHLNSQEGVIEETLDFDRAVGIALDFAQMDGKTLVIITADHETGGVTLTGGNKKLHLVNLSFSTRGHTAVMVPVYAFGPGAERFEGIYDNTDIFKKILQLYDFDKDN
jgi:alkaline phosphatase